jgi:hypothetical protein
LNASKTLSQKHNANILTGQSLFYSVQTSQGIESDSKGSVNNDTTVNEEEVAKFARSSGAEWWSETGEFAALHTMNSVRVPFIRDALLQRLQVSARTKPKPLAGLRIIDVGCGAGILAEVSCLHFAFAVAIREPIDRHKSSCNY